MTSPPDPAERTRETERRRATVLFADITGFSTLNEALDPEEAYGIVTGSLRLLDEIARRHGGSVDKYLGDAIMAVFGIPKAMENAPKAAVNAAIEMHTRIHEYNREKGLAHPLDIHSGINTGLMISGDVSGPVLREFAVMGDAVNIAARLKDMAPKGEIWVGPETWRQTRDEFDYEALESLALKGKAKRVPIYKLLSRTPHLYKPRPGVEAPVGAPLLGREEELARGRRVLAALRERRGGVLALVGEAGLGKSRLAYELCASPEAEDLARLEGRCLAVGAGLGFHPFTDMLRGFAGIGDDDDDRSGWEKLVAALAPVLPEAAEEVAPFLATAMGMRLPVERRLAVRQAVGEALETLIRGAMIRWLGALAEARPLVVSFEDLHWADQSSLELLETLLPLVRSRPILFLLATRPHFPETSGRILEAAAGLPEAEPAAAFTRIELAPLAPAASQELLAHLFEGSDVPAATRDLLDRRAAGNPFFLEEVVRSLLDAEALVRRDGVLFATERLHEVEIPGTVQEVVMARVDRLDPGRRRVLQVASVVGRECPHPVLADVLEEEEGLEEALDALVAAQLLDRVDASGDVRFHHPLIQEVTYQGILKATREELHGRVALAIERELPESQPGRAGMLAYHFGLGGDAETAEAYLARAGDEAARVAASSEALAFFREASRLFLERVGEGGDPRQRATLEKKIAFAHFHRGELLEAAPHFTRALELLGERSPRGRVRTWLALAGTAGSVLARLYLPGPRRARPKASDEEREILDVMFHRARAQTSSDPARFLLDSLWNVRRLHRVDPSSVEMAGGMYAGAIGIFSFGGVSFGLGRRFLEEGERWVDPHDLRDQLLFGFMRFVHHLLEGDWSDAHALAEELLEESLRAGLLWEVVNYLALDAQKACVQGRFEETALRLERMTKLADAYQHDLARSSSHRTRAILATERRLLPAAREACEAYYASLSDDQIKLLALGGRAKVEALAGELEAARRALEAADGIVARIGLAPPFYLGGPSRSRLLADVAALEAAREAGERPGALRRASARSAKQALAHASRVAWRLPEVLRLAGTRDWLCGRRRRARARWAEALGWAERLGAAPEAARVRAERARREPGSRTAEEDRRRAAEAFDALGLPWDAGRLGEGPGDG